MSTAPLLLRQLRYENKSFWRNPAAAFFTFAFPLMFLVIFNLLFGNDEIERFGPPVSGSTFYVPAIAALSIITACYTNIAMGVSITRDEGILKRIRGTPLPQWAYLASRVIHSVLVGFLLVAIVIVAGTLFYSVDVPTDTLPAFAVTVLVGAATFSALGLAMTAAVPNAEAAPAVINATILPLLFISDIFIPLDDAPEWLLWFSNLFPIRHFAEAMLAAFNPFETGSGFRGFDLAVIGGWGLVGLSLALRHFSWEPRK